MEINTQLRFQRMEMCTHLAMGVNDQVPSWICLFQRQVPWAMAAKIQFLNPEWSSISRTWRWIELQQAANSILLLITLGKFISGVVDSTESLETEALKIATLQSLTNIFNILKKKRKLRYGKWSRAVLVRSHWWPMDTCMDGAPTVLDRWASRTKSESKCMRWWTTLIKWFEKGLRIIWWRTSMLVKMWLCSNWKIMIFGGAGGILPTNRKKFNSMKRRTPKSSQLATSRSPSSLTTTRYEIVIT